MAKQFLLIIGFLFSIQVMSQTGIGTTTPNASAKLDVFSDNKGFLPPRVSLISITDQSTILTPATGLLVYCKGDAGLSAGYYFWNGNAWATIATAGGSGSFAASFLRGSRSLAQTGLSNGATVVFTQVDNTSGQEMSLNTSTGQITLAAGRTYRLMAQVPNFQTSNGDTRLQFSWYNETTGAYIGSSSSSYPPVSGASYGTTGGLSQAIISTTTSTVVSYRVVQISNANQLGGSADFNATGSYPWFEAQVISGNAPVTGQSVDYVSVSLTANQTVNTGSIVLFNSNNGGNIPYNASTGMFSLTSGKTYRLTGVIALASSNTSQAEVNVGWRTAAGDIIGGRGEALSSSFTTNAFGAGIADIIYTPQVNTTISLYVTYSNTDKILWQNFTYANIQQIGSSAIINPWTLSGTDTYNTTGNVGIGTNTPTSRLNIAGGGVKLTTGFGNSTNRPSLNTSSIGNYEIRGVGSISGSAQNDLADDGFLRLSAGGGTSVNSQSSIDISGFSTVADMSNNIVMRTNGTERLRIDNSGNVNVTGKLNVTDPSGNVVTKISGIINSGSFVQLDNVKAGPTRTGAGGGYAGLSIGAVSTSYVADVSAMYSNSTVGGISITGVSYTTTGSNSFNGWGFLPGQQSTYILNDITNNRVYRIILMIGSSYNNNFISIERLF